MRDSFVLNALPFDPNDLEDLSAMSLSSPAMLITRSGDTWRLCIRSDNNRRRCAAGIDLAVLYLLDHDTADELSQFMPTCLKRRFGTSFSNTNQPKATPASSRSFFVIDHFGSVLVHTSSCMSSGNSTLQTTYPMLSVSPIHTPPAPLPQASV